MLIVFPFQATVVKAGGYFIAAWPASVAIAIGIALWVSVAIVFGWLTRKLSVRDQAILAPVAIIAVAILTHIALGWTGYTVQQDGL